MELDAVARYTVIAMDAVAPSGAVAVSCADPSFFAVTTPFESAVMIVVSDVDQVTGVTGLPERLVPPKKNCVCIPRASCVLPLVIVTPPVPVGTDALQAPNVLAVGPNQTPLPAR